MFKRVDVDIMGMKPRSEKGCGSQSYSFQFTHTTVNFSPKQSSTLAIFTVLFRLLAAAQCNAAAIT